MSRFSDFIRNATPEEKAEVYAEVMAAVEREQQALLERAAYKPGDPRHGPNGEWLDVYIPEIDG